MCVCVCVCVFTHINLLGDIRLVVWKMFGLFNWYHRIYTELDIRRPDFIMPVNAWILQCFPMSTETTAFQYLRILRRPPWLQACLTSAKYSRGISCNALWSEFAIGSITFAIYALWEHFQYAP